MLKQFTLGGQDDKPVAMKTSHAARFVTFASQII
jgi:hypothetical protein